MEAGAWAAVHHEVGGAQHTQTVNQELLLLRPGGSCWETQYVSHCGRQLHDTACTCTICDPVCTDHTCLLITAYQLSIQQRLELVTLINYYTVKLIRELLYWKIASESEHLKVAIFVYALGLVWSNSSILCGSEGM